jgi:hypothetical protein
MMFCAPLSQRERLISLGAKKFIANMQEHQGWVYAWQADEKPGVRNDTWLNYPLMFEDNAIGVSFLLLVDQCQSYKP